MQASCILRPYFLPSPFLTVFLGCKANARRSVHSPQDHFIFTLIISDRLDWRDTRGKWPLARNPNRSWWHHHTNWKFFWPQPMAPWTTGPLGAVSHRFSFFKCKFKIYERFKPSQWPRKHEEDAMKNISPSGILCWEKVAVWTS